MEILCVSMVKRQKNNGRFTNCFNCRDRWAKDKQQHNRIFDIFKYSFRGLIADGQLLVHFTSPIQHLAKLWLPARSLLG